MSAANQRARHQVLGIVALALFAALFTRLWYLQVLTTDTYVDAAETGRTREVILEAPRGRILDRQGKVLVENRRTIQVQVDYQDFVDLDGPERSELLRNLSRALSEDELLRFDGQRTSGDPGSRDDEPRPSTEGDDEQASDADDEMPVGEGGPTDEGDTVDALDETPDGLDPDEIDTVDLPPPAGVATGAENPGGQGVDTTEPPDTVTADIVLERIEDPRFDKFKPVPVATGISEELELQIAEHPEDFPTVTVERVTSRRYNYGALLAHVLGYVGSITEDELDEFQNDDKPYENDDEIGKAGIERGLERELRGTPGRVVYEVDARNRPIRELREERRDPVAGRDVYLTIDINMQYLMEVGLAAEVERRRGVQDNGCFQAGGCDPLGAASVALDPRDGQVLAMASYPTYDPNLFVGGISTEDYRAIASDENEDHHHYPLLNRALAGQYAPGSTFKLFSAHAALANGIVGPGEYYNDTGKYAFSANCDTSVPADRTNCYAQNAGGVGNGSVDLQRALTVSSDTYFYRIGDLSWRARNSIGDDAMQQTMTTWGLGSPTGIALPGEASGRIPTPEWLMDFSREYNADLPEEEIIERGTWKAGSSANTMVGQGDVYLTPLQLAQGYATLANGGSVWLPQLVLQVTDYASQANVALMDPEVTGQVELPPEWRDPMIAGFDAVTTDGTAAGVFGGFDQAVCPISGKTGTAQVDGKNDTSLFTAYAPTPSGDRATTIAMATVFQEAGFGAAAAAPLTRRVLEPFAANGCDIDRLGNDPAFEAPLGGWFDVEQAIESYRPPTEVSSD